MNRHTDYCEARNGLNYRRSVSQADCPTRLAWMAGYRVGNLDGLHKSTDPRTAVTA